jgi:GNAT superfamily N-acetyltransferase
MATVQTRPVEPFEVERLKGLRLAALLDAPDAFGSDHASEVARPAESWLSWLSPGVTLVAEDANGWHGLVVGKVDDRDTSLALVYSMWVEPAYRHLGVGRLLLSAVVDWASRCGSTRVRLAVADGNEQARRLYQVYGFVPTGEQEPLRWDPSRHCSFFELGIQ